nr:MAG TPA: hypothetical protein [Caudoviricetes sp.]
MIYAGLRASIRTGNLVDQIVSAYRGFFLRFWQNFSIFSS